MTNLFIYSRIYTFNAVMRSVAGEGEQMREEEKVLGCGCKIGRSGKGPWFYDYICETHLPEVHKDGKYSYEKAEAFTKKLNDGMKEQTRKEKKVKNDNP